MAVSPPLGISVHTQRNVGMVDEVCRAGLDCAGGDSVSGLALLVVTGLLAVFVLAAILHLHGARSLLAEERSRTADERDAFDRFTRRIADIDPDGSAPQRVRTDDSLLAVSATAPQQRLDQVKRAYRETVMDVPHYDEEYAEPLSVNMAAEFGDEVATAVVDGDQLTPGLKQALVAKGRDAQQRRNRFIATLDREAEALARADGTLAEVDVDLQRLDETSLLDRSFDELVGVWEDLGGLEDRIEHTIAERQQEVHAESMAYRNGDDPVSLHEYLYRPLPVTHPVLADATDLVDQIRTARHRVVAALTARV